MNRILSLMFLGALALGCSQESDKVIQLPSRGGGSGGGGPSTPAAPPAPTISSMTPPGELPNTTVMVIGSGFEPGMTVAIGSSVAAISTITPTSFNMVLPDIAPGDVDVVVTDTMAMSSTPFTYTMGPTISAATPDGTSPGMNITINGTGFRDGVTITGNFVDFNLRSGAATAEWVDITATGTPGPTTDDGLATIATTFSGNAIWPAGSIVVDSNGNFSTPARVGGGDFSNSSLPTTDSPSPQFFAPYYDDLSPNLGGEIDVQVIDFPPPPATAVTRALIVSWQGVPPFGGTAPGYDVQTQIYEDPFPDGTIARFVYRRVISGNMDTQDNGSDATIGYQNNTNVNGADEFSFNQANAVVDGDVIDLIGDMALRVDFGGTSVPATFISETEIMVNVPAVPAGPTNVTVINPDGRTTPAPVVFNVGP